MLESTFQAHLLRALNAPGRRTRFWRQNAGRFCTVVRGREYWIEGAPTGAADLTGIDLDTGRRLELEVKSSKAQWTTSQRRWANFVERSHGVYVLGRYDEDEGLEGSIARVVAAVDAAREASCTR